MGRAGCVLALALIANVASAQTRTVTVQWDANTEADLAGYVVFVGATPTSFEQRLDVGKVTSRALVVPVSATRYVWVVAYSSGGAQSEPSNVLTLPAVASTSQVTGDADGDGLPDVWEQSNGVTSPTDDQDRDGVTNRDEFQRGTDPWLPNQWILAENATGAFLERLALVNPGAVTASGVVVFRVAGTPRQVPFVITPRSRYTIDVNQALAGLPAQAFTTIVQADRGGVVVERTMQWTPDPRSGLAAGHTGAALATPSREWFFPEVQTKGCESFLHLANESDASADVQVDYRGADGVLVARAYALAPRSRLSVAVHQVPGLVLGGSWARVRSTTPIVAELSMYLVRSGLRVAGDLVPGIAAPSSTWYFADGVTGTAYDTYLVLVNPQPTTVIAQIAWLRDAGTPVREARFLPPNSRTVIAADAVSSLASAVIAPTVVANGPIVAERLVYWPGAPATWMEFHSRTGTPALGTRFVFAEGEVGGTLYYDTFLLLANPGAEAASVVVTPLREAGAGTPTAVTVGPGARVSVRLRDFGVTGRFGLLLDSTMPIAAERSTYWAAGGLQIRGGTNSEGYRVR